MLTMEMSSLSYHPGSSAEGPGSEHVHLCLQCGEVVADTDSGRQEHADSHFSVSLDTQERNSWQQSPELTRVHSMTKRESVVHSTPLQKLKSRNGTFDGLWFVAHEDLNRMDDQPEPGLRVLVASCYKLKVA